MSSNSVTLQQNSALSKVSLPRVPVCGECVETLLVLQAQLNLSGDQELFSWLLKQNKPCY